MLTNDVVSFEHPGPGVLNIVFQVTLCLFFRSSVSPKRNISPDKRRRPPPSQPANRRVPPQRVPPQVNKPVGRPKYGSLLEFFNKDDEWMILSFTSLSRVFHSCVDDSR